MIGSDRMAQQGNFPEHDGDYAALNKIKTRSMLYVWDYNPRTLNMKAMKSVIFASLPC
jgi:hypothetical protein